jgi:hypothetical protein
MRVTCYYEPWKKKSETILRAIADGCGGDMRSVESSELGNEDVSVFYGVRPKWKGLLEQAKHEGRTFWYADNSLFDCARERYFRIARNRLQPTGLGDSDGRRFDALGIDIKPMRDGENVILALQSDEFMACVAEAPYWSRNMTAKLQARHGKRLIVRNKGNRKPITEDLKNAGLLVTWSSASAVTALLEGVPVVCSPECCATYAGEDRRKWANVLADQQWTLDELRDGRLVREWAAQHG